MTIERPAGARRPTVDLAHPHLSSRKWPEANRLSALNLRRPIAERFTIRMSQELQFFARPKDIGGWK